ncbi:alpha-amidating enzyme precursor 1 [Biomphalaria glabrata]|nr:alpha-amidating enzyme precursor 1 [Biomphalaria glabrata]
MMHVQEYYDEYAANDMREKGMYGTATSSEEGLSRNRNKDVHLEKPIFNSSWPEESITFGQIGGVAIDTSGSRKWTAQYFMPHGITADHQGTIWLTDVAMHQVFKIPPAVLMSGEFFVSDGYCKSRVLKFSKDGTFLMSFGKRNVQFGAVPPVVTFDIPHNITVSEEHHLDRENNRIQCFDLDGNFKQVIKRPEFGPRLLAFTSDELITF